MKAHCLYRDFFIFLRMMELEKSPWTAFRRYYYGRHRDFLTSLWHGYQGFTELNIRERAEAIRKGDYADLEEALKLYDIEEETRNAILHCKRIYFDPDQCHVFLYIGFFSPDAFVFKYGQDFVIAVGLERFHDFRNYPVLLAHEYFHYVQDRLTGRQPSDLAESLVSEGLSVCFSMLAYPSRKEHVYFFLTENNCRYLDGHYSDILKNLKSTDGREKLFGPMPGPYPGRAGYFVGYRIVSDYLGEDTRDAASLLAQRERIILDFKSR
jgi:hypothetical protein